MINMLHAYQPPDLYSDSASDNHSMHRSASHGDNPDVRIIQPAGG